MTDIVELGFKADTSGIIKTDAALNKLGNTSDKTAGRLNRDAKSVNSTFTQLNSTLGLVGASIAALGGAALTRDIVRYSDAFTSLESQIRQVTNSENELTQTRERLLSLSNETRSDLDATVKLYTTLQRSTKDLGLESEELAEITGTINNLFLSSGASAQDASNAIRQLSQGLAAGALRGDEFNSVSENAPRIMDALSQSLNKSRGELREFAATGGITSEILINALSDYSDEAENLASQTGTTFEQMSTVIGNNTTNIIGSLDFIGESANSVGQFFVDLTSDISENVNAVNFVINELQRNFELAFAGISLAVDVLGERIGFAISSPIHFIKMQLVDFLSFVADFADKIDSILPEDMQLGFGDSIRDFNSSLVTPEIELYQQRIKELTDNFESLTETINKSRDLSSTEIIDNQIKKTQDIFEEQEKESVKSSKVIKESQEEATKASDEFLELQKEIASGADRIGTAFQTTGNGIIDTFGEAITVLSDFGNEMSRITELQIKLDEEKAKGVDVTKEQAMLNEQMVSAQLSGIGSILGASANLFDEQSKEREALHRAEVAFAAVEIALAAQKAFANAQTAITSAFAAPFPLNFAAGAAMIGIMSALLGTSFNGGSGGVTASTGTGTTLGDDSAQSQSINNSFESLDIQTEQLAELKGINDSMSGLVGAINQLTVDVLSAGGINTDFVTGLGGSGGFDSGGLSGPLGAAAVGAGVAAFTGGAALLSGGLSLVATGILDALTGGFVSDLLDGIIGGLFGSSESFIEDSGIQVLSQTIDDIVNSGDVLAQTFAVVRTESESLFGLISSTSTDTQFGDIDSEFTQGLADIFSFMTDSLLEVGNVLDLAFVHFADGAVMTLEESLSEFTIPELNISFEGKTGEEIEKELQAVIGAVGDDLADFLFPSLREYQQLNEGMYETVIRVAQETVIFTDAMEKLGVNMENMAYLADIEFGQAVIQASGGLEEFTSAFNEFYDIYFTDLEKSINLGASLSDVFEQLNIRMPSTNEEFRTLVEETAAMGEEGAETLAVLLDISPAMAEYNEQLQDQLDILQRSLQGFADINIFMKRIPDEIIPNVGGLDRATTDMLIEQFGSSGAFISAVEDFANMFLSESDAFAVSTASISASFEGLSSILDNTDIPDNTETLNDELNAMNMAIRFGTSSASELREDFASLFTEMSTFDVESGVLSGLLAIAPAMNEYINLLEQQEQALESASDTLENQQEDLFIELLEAQGNSAEALALQRAREIESLQAIDEANRDMGLESNLADLQALIYLQEDYNSALENSQTAVSDTYDALNEAITTQVSVLNDTLNELISARTSLSNAIDTQEAQRLGSFELASLELTKVLNEARGGDLSGVGGLDLSTLTAGDTSGFSSRAEFNLSQARITSQLKELESIVAEEEAAVESEIENLESQLDVARDQRDTLLGIEEAQLNLNDLQAEIDARDAEFQLASTNLATLQLASLDEQLTEQQQADLNQSLIDAQELSFQALISLTEDQRDEITEHLTSLISSTDSSTEAFIAAIDLLRLDIADLAAIIMAGNDNASNFYADMQDLTPANDSTFDYSQIESYLSVIATSSEYLASTTINDDRYKVSLPNSHYRGLFGIQDAVEYLASTTINDDRYKVSLPNSHYRGLFGIQDATEALAAGLINDNRQKVSLPNSHYENQQALIAEIKAMKVEIMEMRERQNTIGVENLRQNRRSADALQEFQYNGIDVNETNAA